LTPLATGSLKPRLLVFSTLGGLTGNDLLRSFFTCDNTSQAATYILQYLAKSQSTQCCQSLITPGSDHPPVLEPHRSSTYPLMSALTTHIFDNQREKAKKRNEQINFNKQSNAKHKANNKIT
jgi:hypothetical protein